MYQIKTKYALYLGTSIRIAPLDAVSDLKKAQEDYKNGMLKWHVLMYPVSNESCIVPLIVKENLTENDAREIMGELYNKRQIALDSDYLSQIEY